MITVLSARLRALAVDIANNVPVGTADILSAAAELEQAHEREILLSKRILEAERLLRATEERLEVMSDAERKDAHAAVAAELTLSRITIRRFLTREKSV